MSIHKYRYVAIFIENNILFIVWGLESIFQQQVFFLSPASPIEWNGRYTNLLF